MPYFEFSATNPSRFTPFTVRLPLHDALKMNSWERAAHLRRSDAFSIDMASKGFKHQMLENMEELRNRGQGIEKEAPRNTSAYMRGESSDSPPHQTDHNHSFGSNKARDMSRSTNLNPKTLEDNILLMEYEHNKALYEHAKITSNKIGNDRRSEKSKP